MKKLKLSLATLAIAIAIFGAAGTHAANQRNVVKDEESLFWYPNDDASGTPDHATPTDEIAARSCTGTAQLCENGYRADQYITNGVPSSGLKSGEVENPDMVLTKN